MRNRGGSGRQRKGKSAVGQFLDRMRQSSYRVGEGSRSRNGGGVPEEGKRKRGRHRKSGGGGKWVGSWKVLSPATADGTRVGGGRRGKGKGSGGSRQVGCRVTSGSEVNSYPLAATAGEPKTKASDLHSESGVG